MPTALEYIKENLTKEMILDLLTKHGAKRITINDTEIRSTCPIHGGDNPTAFVWNLENHMWYCFTECGCGGDVFQFVANIHDLDINNEFKTVINTTASELDIDISNLELGERANRNKKELRAWLAYCDNVNNKKNKAFEIKTLGQRFVLNSYRNLTPDILKRYNVTYNGTYKRVQFPIYDEDGNCVGAVLRRTNEADNKKWINRPKGLNTGEVLYNLNNIPETQLTVRIVEGVYDALNLISLGIDNVVCTFGAHLTDEQIDLIISRFLNVILMYDNDNAGIKATVKAIKRLSHLANVYVSDLSKVNKKDPGELTREDLDNIQEIAWYNWIKEYQ